MIEIVHLFVEEESAKKVLDAIMPRILPVGVYFRVYSHQGKQDLEKAIKSTIPSISKIPGARICILRDQDSGDCRVIKANIETFLEGRIFAPSIIRIVCRELETWFLGDLLAIERAYPRFNHVNYSTKREFRNVDNIQNANKMLLGIIPEYKDFDHLPKVETAESISPYLDLENNRSTSFIQFVQGIKKLLQLPR